jgi:hypothetical protein
MRATRRDQMKDALFGLISTLSTTRSRRSFSQDIFIMDAFFPILMKAHNIVDQKHSTIETDEKGMAQLIFHLSGAERSPLDVDVFPCSGRTSRPTPSHPWHTRNTHRIVTISRQ